MSHIAAEADVFARVERAILQVGWLGQRQFMQLLSEERFGLTIPQFYTLLQLTLHEGACKMSDLARATHQSAASLTGVIDRLLDKQLVARIRHEGDRRQVNVVLTTRGQALLTTVNQARTEQLRSAFRNMSSGEAAMLIRLLDSICEDMAAQIAGRVENHIALESLL
ncbi:MAG: MarR family transcriptional regulator [Roseiflexaceae bacterium]|nr:MarR family transcriptional regulator [Roseiflexaceae bacterium]